MSHFFFSVLEKHRASSLNDDEFHLSRDMHGSGKELMRAPSREEGEGGLSTAENSPLDPMGRLFLPGTERMLPISAVSAMWHDSRRFFF